jgi:XTP/dITP diphosphohydrolase
MRHALVIATTNRGKLAELRELLAPLPLDLLSIADVSKTPIHVVEDGDTFEANAIKKAREVSAATMMWTLADDSGLEVDALGGAPGVLSARYAGERATDAENNAALLSALAEAVPQTGLRAQFRCVLALVDPFVRDGEPYVVEGACEGTITTSPRGAGGFGYDPLFVVEGTGKTMAELDEAEKNRLSHRARAMEKLRLVLERTIAARDALTRTILG